jgi:hypothetical protein
MERLKRWSLFVSPSRATIECNPRALRLHFDDRFGSTAAAHSSSLSNMLTAHVYTI